jgi:hypothetical protein
MLVPESAFLRRASLSRALGPLCALPYRALLLPPLPAPAPLGQGATRQASPNQLDLQPNAILTTPQPCRPYLEQLPTFQPVATTGIPQCNLVLSWAT